MKKRRRFGLLLVMLFFGSNSWSYTKLRHI